MTIKILKTKGQLWLFLFINVLLIIFSLFFGYNLKAQTRYMENFNRSKVFPKEVIAGTPFNYSTPDKIREYLVSKGSFLANHRVVVSFESDDTILNTVSNVPPHLQPNQVLAPFLGKEISVPELIWRLSMTDMGNSCDRQRVGICIDNRQTTLNPAYLLALLQKESGLIYGANSRLNPNSETAKFLLDRATGYYCFENPEKSKSCYDENPNWKYFKGFFRQLYYAARLTRINEKRCEYGSEYAFVSVNGRFQAGSTVTINGENIFLSDPFTCSMYIYTPHISAQKLIFDIMKEIGADINLLQILGIDPNYKPEQVILF